MVVLWLGCCCRPSVNTICGRIMIGLSLSFVSKHNMWSYYDWVVVRQQTQYVVVLWLGCCCRSSVNTICGRIMIGLPLSSVSKHNMSSYYDWVVVVFVVSKQNMWEKPNKACWSSTKRASSSFLWKLQKCNLFSPWYSCQIAELALNNNHSLHKSSYASCCYRHHHDTKLPRA